MKTKTPLTKSVSRLLDITGMFSLAFLLGCVSEKEKQKPNVIIIMADDLGYGDLSCYGSEYIQTPNIDSLSEHGLTFTDYHSNSSVSTPTRAALLTGRYQQRSGLEGVIYVRGETRQTGMAPSEITFADVLKDAGYTTGIMGKWHLGYKKKFNPVHQGFDEFYGYLSGNIDFHSHYDNAGIYDWWHNLDTIREEGYVTDLITDHSVEFIRENKDKPFLLYIPHEAPHVPFQGRNDTAYRYPDRDFSYLGPVEDTAATYREMVEVMDEGIGRVMKTLRDLDLEEETFVVFCSDNGARFGSNGNLRGDKGTLWEGGHRVPAVAYWKGKIEPGRIDELAVSFDLFPTMLSITNTKKPDTLNLDGMDLSPLLFQGETLPERTVVWRYRGEKAVRKGPWKLMITESDTLLFDLETDRDESNDLARENPGKVEELLNEYRQWKADVVKGVTMRTD
ncbi:MAG: sulfatase-like hydrolase/transferase [Bacteroidota bacterium]